MDYTTVPFAEVQAGLDDVAAATQSTFGALDARQLNWRPDATRWSVAQCFEHLLTANRLMEDAADILHRFMAQNDEIVRWLRGLGEPRAAGVVMTSPFVSFIVYSVLGGARLVLAHDHRHFEQARRVMQAPGFPPRL